MSDHAAWRLRPTQLADLYLLDAGFLAPLDGYLGAAEAAAVRRGEPVRGRRWPAPVTLRADAAVSGADLALLDAEGVTLATVREATRSLDDAGQLVHGRLEIHSRPAPEELAEHYLTAGQVRDRLGRAGRPAAVAVVSGPPTRQVEQALAEAAEQGPLAVLLDAGHELSDRAFEVAEAWTLAVRRLPDAVLTLLPLDAVDPARRLLGVVAAANVGAGTLLLGRSDDEGLPEWAAAWGLTVRRAGTAHLFLAAPEPAPLAAYAEDVAVHVRRAYPPPAEQGVTVFFTGFSGSGKSTVARALAGRARGLSPRRVTLLDGDVVRHHLSSGLGFSKADRETNVRRIGWVAAQITRNGGLAICAPIAPYASTRAAVRDMVSEHGGFVLVHVATPLAECERRDRKGLYARARRGEIPEFTGISDPYEVPEDAEVVLDTSTQSVEDSVATVLAHLRRAGYLPD